MQIVQVVGARPQFIKLSPVSAAVRDRGHQETIVHTGQHFDPGMSQVFFDELGIPAPAVDLGVHGLTHGAMTGRMLEGIERVVHELRPDAVVVYGDTDSTLAGVLAAVKLGLRCAHVEAGLRSFDRTMPEELNRVAADHLADLLFAPTATAGKNLAAEGLAARTVVTGDVMYDALLRFRGRAAALRLPDRLGLQPGRFVLATIHRAGATDDPTVLAGLVQGLALAAEQIGPVVWPVHPRTRAALARHGIDPGPVRPVEPLSYLETLGLLQAARAVVTDSGGLQKEAYWAGRPCFTLRANTEWIETVEAGANVICGLSPAAIGEAIGRLAEIERTARFGLPVYGSGDAATAIVTALEGDAGGRERGRI